MSDTTRIVLIALGVALIVVVLLPFLFMGGMMGAMMSGGMMGGGAAWLMFGLPLLVLLIGGVLLALGLRRR
jgi:hypothetical protein